MARTKIATIAAAFVLCAVLALVAGCSSSSSSSASAAAGSGSASAAASAASASATSTATASASKSATAAAKTLEEYFAANKAEWETAVAQIKEKAGDTMDVDMSLAGNKISQIMTYKVTYSEEAVAQMKERFAASADSLRSQTGAQIKTMEQALGVNGITWYFDYRNGDGASIYATEIGAN